MKKEDKRTIVRLVYSSVWWVTFIIALMIETSGGRWYALASTIIYMIVLYSDAKAESLEEKRKADRKRLAANFEKEMNDVRESYRYSGRTMQ
jgi:cytochrome c biogenesis protein ResB